MLSANEKKFYDYSIGAAVVILLISIFSKFGIWPPFYDLVILVVGILSVYGYFLIGKNENSELLKMAAIAMLAISVIMSALIFIENAIGADLGISMILVVVSILASIAVSYSIYNISKLGMTARIVGGYGILSGLLSLVEFVMPFGDILMWTGVLGSLLGVAFRYLYRPYILSGK